MLENPRRRAGSHKRGGYRYSHHVYFDHTQQAWVWSLFFHPADSQAQFLVTTGGEDSEDAAVDATRRAQEADETRRFGVRHNPPNPGRDVETLHVTNVINQWLEDHALQGGPAFNLFRHSPDVWTSAGKADPDPGAVFIVLYYGTMLKKVVTSPHLLNDLNEEALKPLGLVMKRSRTEAAALYRVQRSRGKTSRKNPCHSNPPSLGHHLDEYGIANLPWRKASHAGGWFVWWTPITARLAGRLARELVQGKLPRPGYELNLGELPQEASLWLENVSGKRRLDGSSHTYILKVL